ncbi:MAG TPA: D-Ala-D-Ala carboxypeptidase family metallohydrolase [Polyangiaceae bacterium]
MSPPGLANARPTELSRDRPARHFRPADLQNRLAGTGPLSETSWVISGLLQGRPYRLAVDAWRPFLERFLEPSRNHTPEWRTFLRGAYGPAKDSWVPPLRWGTESGEGSLASEGAGLAANDPEEQTLAWLQGVPGFASPAVEPEPLVPDWAPRPQLLGVVKSRPCPYWKAPQAVAVARNEGEREVLAFTDCDGAIASDALERLSVLARPAHTPRPELPLPPEPVGSDGEWLPDVRLLHPRLVWVLAELARSFPNRTIVFYSGYRRDAHSSNHRTGRALDLTLLGVPNEELFAACRRLRDVGCGFYPNNRFVHVDVRAYATGRVAWVDVSRPGEPSVYADGWPGVLDAGIGWLGGG